ncbi:FAD-binding oxidoreductase [Smaragdicoccus niigatensis]|uniref:FAD-binding oxidoreductase n=1 Tax=Smaragdicoccus niigatensis TaxID=359359 RepID=UPI00039B21E6|nr:FAD-binding oxidoreductase [Smaragdicoccus niigatensis]
MIVGTKYVSSDVDTNYDAIVIGSGLGGMTTAALMAKAGRKVLVLEQHYTAGGFSHSWGRRGFTWDAGVHYIGRVHNPRSFERQLFDLITDGQLKWAKMDPVYDRIVIGDQTYDYVAGAKNFREKMLEYFPNRQREIDTYLRLVRESTSELMNHFGPRLFPGIIQAGLKGVTHRTGSKYFERTTQEVLESFIDDPKLISVLCGQWGDYGTTPRRSAFGAHAATVQHYLDGASFPIGGASAIAGNIVPIIERAGGMVCTQAEVDEILIRRNRAVGVRMANGDEIQADQVISATGLFNTWNRLLPPQVREQHGMGDKLARLKPAIAHVGLYLGIDGTTEELGLEQANLWIYRGYDHDAEFNRFAQQPNTDFYVNYITFPSTKDPDWPREHPGKSAIDAIAAVPYDWFKKWERKPWGDRGADYEAFKQQFADAMLADVYKYAPGVRGKVEVQEVSTPLSTAHFSNYANGPLYGLEHTVERFSQSWIKPTTPIKGLYLTGQDTLLVGIVSAMASGLLTATQTLGPAFARLLPELGLVRGLPASVLGKVPGIAVPAPKPAVKLTEPDPLPRTFTARCVEVIDVTADTRALRFMDGSGADLIYKPGQFLTFHLDIDGTTCQRSYSMSSDPTNPKIFEVTVKRIDGGLVSNWLCDSVRVGDELTVSGAHGHFTCAPNPRRKLLMLSAGSGITPMLSMSRWIVSQKLDVDVVFFHNARSRDDFIFGAELTQLAQDHPNFTLHLSLTREGPKQGWDGPTGYLDSETLEHIAPDLAERHAYSCGPEGFMESVRGIVEDTGFRMSRFFEESYASPEAIVTPGGNLVFTRSNKTVPCASLQTVLEAAEAGGLKVDNACRTGDCGECTLKTLSGTVEMSSTAGLDPADAEEGAILSCVAYIDGDVLIDA